MITYYLEKIVAGAWVIDSTYTDPIAADAACAALMHAGETVRLTTNACPFYAMRT